MCSYKKGGKINGKEKNQPEDDKGDGGESTYAEASACILEKEVKIRTMLLIIKYKG